MIRFRRHTAYLLPVILMFILNSCSYHTASRSIDSDMARSDETVIIHSVGQIFELHQAWVENESVLQGTVYSIAYSPSRGESHDPGHTDIGGTHKLYKTSNEVHVHVNPSYVVIPPGSSADPFMVAIPLDEISKVEVHEVDVAKTIINTIGVLVMTAGIALLIIAATKDSCPFVYVQDGDDFILVGEIYSGAIHPPLERHDYMPLPVTGDGDCTLKITNEVLEIQHTNLTELQVFDHAPGERVLVDRHGTPHRVAEPSPPVIAESYAGEDIRPIVATNDKILFIESANEEDASGMDGMILTFDRPPGARALKLIVNARNSPWMDHVLGILFERMGDMFKPWQEAQKTGSAESMHRWSKEQGLPLSVALMTADGWCDVDHYALPGPIAPRDAVLALDLSGCEGDRVTVKLECGYRFWEIDSVQADFTPDVHPRGTTVRLCKAVTKEGLNVTADLLDDDDRYLHQPDLGDEAILDFELPDLAPGLARSVILHSKGHYDILRDPTGRPDAAFLASLRDPGRVTDYSRDMYKTSVNVSGR